MYYVCGEHQEIGAQSYHHSTLESAIEHFHQLDASGEWMMLHVTKIITYELSLR